MVRGIAALGGALAVLGSALATAPAAGAQERSANIAEVASAELPAEAADVAFWGDRAAVSLIGNGDANDGFALIDIEDPRRPRLVSEFRCSTTHFDISMWDDLVILGDNYQHAGEGCDEPGLAFGDGFAGIRIVSIADERRPRLVANVDSGCVGSHTFTVIPDLDRGRLVVWVNGGGGPQPYNENHLVECDSIVEVPLDDPARSRRIAGRPLGTALTTCHDVTVNVERELAVGACFSDLRVFDISDPAAPTLLSLVPIPGTTIIHNASFSNDGMTLAVTDEQLPGQAGIGGLSGCFGDLVPRIGAIYFLDVSNPHLPVERGSFQLPRTASGYCTAHQHNVVPLADDRDVLVSAWYERGVSVIDFTDPAAPREVAYATGDDAVYWSAYWYNGFVWATSFGRHVLDVFGVRDPAVEGWVRTTRLDAQTNEPLAAVTAQLALDGAAVRRGRRLTVRVTQTDGLTTRPARRATVRVRGRRTRTGASGRATLRLPARAGRRVAVTVSKAGYPSLRLRARAR